MRKCPLYKNFPGCEIVAQLSLSDVVAHARPLKVHLTWCVSQESQC
jgi:hypothetical protein